MPPDETLSAVISATDDVSNTLERIAKNFQDIAESATAAGSAARNAAGDFDEAEDEGSALNRALDSVAESGTTAAGGVGAAAAAAEGAESSFDDAEDEVSEFNRELNELIAKSAIATTGLGKAGAVARSMQSSFDYPFGIGEEEKSAQRVIARMEEGADIMEEQGRLSWFDDTPRFREAENKIEDRGAFQLPLDTETFEDATASAHLRSEGFDGVDETLRRIGQRQRELGAEFDLDGEVDIDDQPLQRVENTLVRVGDRLGFIDSESYEAEVDVDADDTPINRVVRTLGDFERGMDRVDGREVETEVEVDVDENHIGRVAQRLGGRFADRFGTDAGSATDSVVSTLIDWSDSDVQDPAKARKELKGLGRVMQRLPDLNLEGVEDLDELADELENGVKWSNKLGDDLEKIGDDDIIRDSSSLDDLHRRLRQTDYDTRSAERSIERLEGSGRDLASSMVADAQGIKSYRKQVDEVGDEALDTSVRIQKLKGEVRSMAVTAVTGAATMLGLGAAIDAAGDEAGSGFDKVEAISEAMEGLGPNIADVSTSFAGFRTSLKTLAQLAPMMFSLAAALGAVATAGAAAVGGLGFIMAGGILAAGTQRGDQLAAMPGDPEDMDGPMKDAHEATSELGRTMAGVEDIMGDLKQAAFEAMAPLRTPEFADFSLWVLENAVTLLHEVAQGVAAMADPFMDFARVAQASFWETFPEVVHQMNMIVLEFLTGDLTTSVIEAIPGILESFRTEGRELIPMISELVAEWIQVLPSLMRLGTAMLKFLIPALLGVAKGLNLVSPLTEFAAEALTLMADVLGPVIEGFFGLMGIIYGAAMTMTAATSAVVGLLAIMTGALAIVAGWIWTFGKLIKLGMWFAGAIVKLIAFITGLAATVVTAIGILVGLVLVIAGLLTYFDLWDEALVGLAKTWNWIVGLFNSGAGLVADGIEAMVNTGIRALNRLIEKVDSIPGVDQLEEIDLEGEDTFSQHKVDTEKARSFGERLNMGERAEKGIQNPADDLDPTPSGTGGGDRTQGHPTRGGQGAPQNTGANIETINVFSSPETDDEEIRRAARQAVEDANKRERRSSSPLN